MMAPPFGRLGDFPRVRLAAWPTPLEPLANLGRDLGQALFVKRDDSTGLAFGGNKVRQLEYYLGAARAQAADTLLITGAVQSNFVRLTAAAASRLGLDCHIQLEERVAKTDAAYRHSGNVLLDRLLGATLHSYPEGEDEAGADRRLGEIAAELAARGRRPYVIPLAPGHPPLGALGYLHAAAEILDQVRAARLDPAEIMVASGSGHSHTGLLFGLRALGSEIPVLGACVRRGAQVQRLRIAARCREIAELLEIDSPVSESDIRVEDAYLAPGYGLMGPAAEDALLAAARREGLLLDPVYTAKSMAAFLARARAAPPGETWLFVHTGGTPALFGYESQLRALFERA